MSFLTDLHPLMSDTVIAQPGYLDGFGTFVASGSTSSLANCRIKGESVLVRDINGQEVVSSMQVIVGSYNNLTTEAHRYTLPSRYDPNSSLRAISIKKVSDETGPLYEKLMFP